MWPMATLRMFAAARQAAGTDRDELDGTTVAEVLAGATARYGPGFAQVLGTCRIWVNGEAADASMVVEPGDEVAVLPPVSGGADAIEPGALSLAELRATRTRLQHEDDVVSYVRRIAQARLDLVRAAVGSSATDRDISGELRSVLSRQLTGGAPRPPRPVDEESELADTELARELEQLCTDLGLARLGELDATSRRTLVVGLEEFEARISADRRERFEVLDALSAELVRRYRDGEASVDSLLDDGLDE